MRKKIEFERKALHIVEQLLEEDITEEFLRECVCVEKLLHYLNLYDMKLPCIIKIFDSVLSHKMQGACYVIHAFYFFFKDLFIYSESEIRRLV